MSAGLIRAPSYNVDPGLNRGQDRLCMTFLLHIALKCDWVWPSSIALYVKSMKWIPDQAPLFDKMMSVMFLITSCQLYLGT